jgi:redox-sensitive bicupin YhaK (pirin superfamily)
MDMEILSYIVEGDCYHNDNLRNIMELPSGCVQHMSSGTGIWHIEGNNKSVPNRYLQIWLRPNRMGIQPKYDFKAFSRERKLNNFCTIASQLAGGNNIVIQSDAHVSAGIFTENYTKEILSDKKYYMYVVSGTATVNDIICIEGDAMIYENESLITIESPDECEVLLFTLP